LLKFYTRHGRFPAGRSELPDEAVAFVAKQVRVPASDLGFYEWSGSTIEYHRSQVREYLGFRVCSVADADKLTDWLNRARRARRAEPRAGPGGTGGALPGGAGNRGAGQRVPAGHCLQAVTSVAGSGTLPPDVIAERLMLAIYAYGTNTGIRSVISAEHGHTEEDVRYARRRDLTRRLPAR
jgi:hypothetical protein